jgi:hypothetical protein
MKFRVILTVAIAVTAACAAEPEQPQEDTAGQVQEAFAAKCQECTDDSQCAANTRGICGSGPICESGNCVRPKSKHGR